ncbi:LysR family transcriptional regulator [Telluria mixta]|uniref:LysR family transcriptional regulator n=1 Tax=Telluria mixta TaxID=34071 RepID=A0ABT2BS04_9BURK|nr:LysR family transcriptional regulator [Telluria mixta]MCS0627897.1 LysR family transcriptional regulator [Telluria mixta]WEM93984.1 LysR family transcriptional regulator [Telluria mixta]
MRFKHLDLNLLVGLNVLLEEQSITRAARRLHLSQSATSGILSRIREHFKDEVLVTVGKSMILTPFGATLVEPIRNLLDQIQHTVGRRPAVLPEDARRKFKLIASDYITTVLMADVSRHVQRIAPGVAFESVDPSADSTELFERGEIDLLITVRQYCLKSLPTRVLMEESFTGVVWTGNTVVGNELTLEQYLSLGHVISQFGMDSRDSCDHAFMKSLGYARHVEMATSNFNTVPHFVVGTNRIATVQTRLAKLFTAHYPLRIVPVPVELPKLEMCMQWHEFMDQEPLHLWLRDTIAEIARSEHIPSLAFDPPLAALDHGPGQIGQIH